MTEAGKSSRTIRRHLKQLRVLIDTTHDPIESRVAYAMECAVRWATEKTTGWEGLAEQARTEAAVLRREVQK